MRYAIFSDIHGNLQAWEAIHQDMVALEADVLVCLGDVVGYGPLPEEVLKAIRKVTPNFVLGNHDAAAAGLIEPSLFNPHARSAIEWTRKQLSRKSLDFLRKVPLKLQGKEMLFVHAEVTSPERFGYIENAQDAHANFSSNKHFVTFIGHTHHPAIFELDPSVNSGKHAYRLPDEDCQLDAEHRYIINVGSVGEPRNPDDIRARYVIYDSDTREVYFRRIFFDPEAYRRDLAGTSLDDLPYFLQVVDHHAALEAEAYRAMTIDMQIPVFSPQYAEQFYHGTSPQQLYIPENIGTGSKPKPMPAEEHKKLRAKYAVAFTVALLLLAAIGFVAYHSWIGDSERKKAGGVSPADSRASFSGSNPGAVSPPAKNTGPQSPGGTGSSGSPDAKPPEIARTEPAAINTGTTPGHPKDPQPGETVEATSPEPVLPPPSPTVPPTLPKTGEDTPPVPGPVSKVVANWRMNKDSVGPVLLDSLGKHSLHARTPGRAIERLAPDPIPLTGTPNNSALALGVWAEPNATGDFQLAADRSFTFEGWLMTNKTKKPIFLGGTRPKEEGNGWRLDVLASKNERSRGSMRFYYQGAGEPLTVLTTGIELYNPDPHHFAVVWNHQGGAAPDKGKISLFYDGAEVAVSELAHASIVQEKGNPFQLGTAANPTRVALDEVRFTAEALHAGDFLNCGLGPDSLGALAFMIDVGPPEHLYTGVDSPGHADHAIPKTFTNWIAASHETEQFALTRSVKQANGDIYPLPLTIDFGLSAPDKPGDGIVWEEKNIVMESLAEKQQGVFALDHMDRFHDPEGKRSLGLRVRGLEKGRYQLFFTPFVGTGTREQHDFALGVDLDGDPVQVRTMASQGMKKMTYPDRKATPNDRLWAEERNFFSEEIEIKGAKDYIVVIVGAGQEAAIPYLQIVKEGSSVLPRSAPIEFRFDDGKLSNQASQLHPAITRVSEMRSTGFKDEPMKLEPGGGGEGGFVLNGTVNNPSAEVKDHFHFTFVTGDNGARLDGFSMEVSGPQQLFHEVSLHKVQKENEEKSPKISDLIARSQTPGELRWSARGTLAGEEALAIHLDPGTYEIRIAGMDTNGAKKLTVDDVRVDFARR